MNVQVKLYTAAVRMHSALIPKAVTAVLVNMGSLVMDTIVVSNN